MVPTFASFFSRTHFKVSAALELSLGCSSLNSPSPKISLASFLAPMTMRLLDHLVRRYRPLNLLILSLHRQMRMIPARAALAPCDLVIDAWLTSCGSSNPWPSSILAAETRIAFFFSRFQMPEADY
jgi:hypothetical protein